MDTCVIGRASNGFTIKQIRRGRTPRRIGHRVREPRTRWQPKSGGEAVKGRGARFPADFQCLGICREEAPAREALDRRGGGAPSGAATTAWYKGSRCQMPTESKTPRPADELASDAAKAAYNRTVKAAL